MQRILHYFDAALYWLVVVLTAALAAVGFATVIFRYVLHSSLFWGDEFLRYLSIWLVFLGAALATRHRALITVDVFTQPMTHRWREYTAAAVSAASSVFLLVLAYISLDLVWRSVGVVSAAMGIPMEYMYLVFPVGLGVMAVNMLREVAAHLAAARGNPSDSTRTEAPPDLLAHPE